MSLIYAYSRFTWIFPIKSKAETLTIFQKFKSMVKLQFNSKIKHIQSDLGGKYRPFTNFLAHHGVYLIIRIPTASLKL